MTALAKRQGYKDLAAYRAALKKNPQQYARSREQILRAVPPVYRQDGGPGRDPVWNQPRAELVVEAVEPFREKESGQAMYYLGAADGSHKGTRGGEHPRSRAAAAVCDQVDRLPRRHSRASLSALAGARAEGCSTHRQYATYSAFMEGWALYAERLGKEVGLYQDPRTTTDG